VNVLVVFVAVAGRDVLVLRRPKDVDKIFQKVLADSRYKRPFSFALYAT
jgi:hypothetical protein